MALTKRWAGKVFGTNIGNVFVSLDGEDNALTGTVRINEAGVGIYVFNVQGNFVAPTLTMTGEPQAHVDGLVLGNVTIVGTMNAKGELHGDWTTTIGSGGTFVLFPHNGPEDAQEGPGVEQFYVARHNFGAMEIDRQQIIDVAESIRQELPTVVITVGTGTEQARYLDDFKILQFTVDRAQTLRIYGTKPDGAGSNQVVSIEMGPLANAVMTQGASEAWVVGRLETLKRDLKRFERTYVTNFKRWAGQVLLFGALVLLPSFGTLLDRAIFLGAGVALIAAVNGLHTRYLPFAAIYLREKKKSLISRFGPSVTSWVFAIVATVIAALLAAYLQGWLQLPGVPEKTPAQIKSQTSSHS